MPVLGLIPLFILWLGIGETFKIAIIAIVVYIPIYLNLYASLTRIDNRYVELAETLRLSRRRFVRAVVIPGSLPGFFVGLRLGVTGSWLALVVLEQINATSGLGYMMFQAQNYGRTDIILVGLASTPSSAWRPTPSSAPSRGGCCHGSARWRVDPPIAAVHIRGLTRRFGDHAVLDGLDLDIPAGQFVALLGHSGSGKSTLLRALALLDHDVEGAGELAAPERLSVVFQDSRLLPWRRVLDNVLLGAPGPDAVERGRGPWPRSVSPAASDHGPASCPVVRRSAPRSPDRSCGIPNCCSPTSLSARSTRSPACACTSCCASCGSGTDPPCSSSRMTSTRPIVLADRVIILEHGRVGVDLTIDLPHPRSYREPQLGRYRDRLLEALGVQSDVGGDDT